MSMDIRTRIELERIKNKEKFKMNNDNINLWNSLCEQGIQIYGLVKNDIEYIIKEIDKQGYTGFEIKSILQDYINCINAKLKSLEEGGK